MNGMHIFVADKPKHDKKMIEGITLLEKILLSKQNSRLNSAIDSARNDMYYLLNTVKL